MFNLSMAADGGFRHPPARRIDRKTGRREVKRDVCVSLGPFSKNLPVFPTSAFIPSPIFSVKY